MSWLLNLWQLGRGVQRHSERSPNGVMGSQYVITAKTPAAITLSAQNRALMRGIQSRIFGRVN